MMECLVNLILALGGIYVWIAVRLSWILLSCLGVLLVGGWIYGIVRWVGEQLPRKSL